MQFLYNMISIYLTYVIKCFSTLIKISDSFLCETSLVDSIVYSSAVELQVIIQNVIGAYISQCDVTQQLQECARSHCSIVRRTLRKLWLGGNCTASHRRIRNFVLLQLFVTYLMLFSLLYSVLPFQSSPLLYIQKIPVSI